MSFPGNNEGTKEIKKDDFSVTKESLKSFLEQLAQEASANAEKTGTKTVTAMDVVKALKTHGKFLYSDKPSNNEEKSESSYKNKEETVESEKED